MAALNKTSVFTAVGCAGGDIFCGFIRGVLPREGTYAEPPRSATLIKDVTAYVDSKLVSAPAIEALSAEVVIPQGLTYVRGDPAPTVRLSQGASLLKWSLAATGPVTFSYMVRSESAGQWPVTTTTRLTDTVGGTAAMSDSLQVIQSASCVAPTETPVPSVTPQPTATWTATPATDVVYLPIALYELNCSRAQALDVALVLDTSSSMLEESPTKLSRATYAIGAFAESLKPGDQVALITFDSAGRILQSLTRDQDSVRAAFLGLSTGTTTRIDLGIEVAHGELVSPRASPGARKVMIVLTDGLPNPVGPDEVLNRAEAAKRDDVTLLTIGLGDGVDHDLLRASASDPSLYYEAPTASDLDAIYRRLLISIPCDEEPYWGGR